MATSEGIPSSIDIEFLELNDNPYIIYKYNNKKIEAIICKTQFEDVKEALLEAKIEWFSYYNVKGIGKTCQGRI